MRHAFEQIGALAALRIASTEPQAIQYLSGAGMFSDRTTHPVPSVVLLDINLPGCRARNLARMMSSGTRFRAAS